MRIDFNEIEEKALPRFKGGEQRMMARIADDGSAKIMSNRLEPGASIGRHSHDDSCEVIFITSGRGEAVTAHGVEALSAGDCHYCPHGEWHELRNAGVDDLCFLAVVPTLTTSK